MKSSRGESTCFWLKVKIFQSFLRPGGAVEEVETAVVTYRSARAVAGLQGINAAFFVSARPAHPADC